METKDDFISRTIKTQKLFNITPGQCYYANIEITKKIEKSGQDSKIKISNNVCKQSDSCLLKVTQIRFDSYCFKSSNQKDYQIIPNNSSAPTNSSDGSQNNNSLNENMSFRNNAIDGRKRKLIFKKKTTNQNSQPKMERRNTKNIAKNFCKAFMTYLEEQKQQQMFAKLKKLIEVYRFNNKVIEKIATDELINNEFKKFLTCKAEEWIQSSKIHDKQIHCEAIKLYLQLIEDGFRKMENGQEQSQSSSSKSIYHSDSPYDGSSEDNGRQISRK